MTTLTLIVILFLALSSLDETAHCCNQLERDSLLQFISTSSSSLNWSSSTNCCKWEGITCAARHGGTVTHLSLPEKHLSGDINATTLANLPFLAHINLSHNHFSGPSPLPLLHFFTSLQTLDLSFNSFSGPLQYPPSSTSIGSLNLSSNRLIGFIDPLLFHRTVNLVSLDVCNNSLSGHIPPSLCKNSPLVRILDFSMNQFTGSLSGFGDCSHLEVIRAGFNSLSGGLPDCLYEVRTLRQISLHNNHFSGPIKDSILMLSNLSMLELQVNGLSGNIPSGIGSLSNLERFQLHNNKFTGGLPPSLMNCSKLTTLLLRNNQFGGRISTIDFSQLQRLQAIDLGNNSFVGRIPDSLCSCSSLSAVRLAKNQLDGEIPPCMATITSLKHLSLSDNHLSDVVGALNILRQSESLAVLLLSRCFINGEMMLDDIHVVGFKNLLFLALSGDNLKGQIPQWISKLTKLRVLNLSHNRISGRIPTWLGEMPNLCILNLTGNLLSSELPRELSRMPALLQGSSAVLDMRKFLALPVIFNSREYTNLRRALKLNNNSLTGSIPTEIGQLRLLQQLHLNDNNFHGSIPTSLSLLTNLEKLDMSRNHLSGEIPYSLRGLHFLSEFRVAGNDLEGEIPRGGQFETFSEDSFEDNPKLCGLAMSRQCHANESEENGREDWWYDGDHDILYFASGLGYFVGLVGFLVKWLC